MRFSSSSVSVLMMALTASSTGFASAFTFPSASQAVTLKSTSAASYLYMSSTDEEDDEDDIPMGEELSKLIGKRASLSKLREEAPPQEKKAPSTEQSDEITVDASTASLYEGKSGLDMFDMPDFSSKRPLRASPEANDKSRGGDGSKGDEEDDTYIDFQGDYDDENDLHISNRLGFSTKDWGETKAGFKAGKKLKKKEIKKGKFLAGDLQVAYNSLMAAGITLVDTSENYGLESRSASLSAEQILGQCMDTSASAPLLATTMSNPWKSLIQGTGVRIGAAGILKALENSADRLGVGEIDLYQVPAKMFYLGTPKVVANALVGAMDQGIIQHVGGVNMSKSKMARFHKNLSSGGYGLTSNAFEFSLVNRNAWKSGLISSCKSLGVIPIAQNPLGNGLASGEYTATNPTGGKVSGKSSFEFKELEKYTTLHDMLETVQKKVQGRLEGENRKLKDRRDRYGGDAINTDVTTTQIAINYVVAKGCVPVPTINNPREADELIACLGWDLTDEEVKMLDNAADMSDKGRIV